MSGTAMAVSRSSFLVGLMQGQYSGGSGMTENPLQCANISFDFEELGPVRCELPEGHVGDHKRHILHRW